MRRKAPWLLWLASSIVMATYLGMTMIRPEADRSVFLPGVTTAGHYQIELACNVCHTPGGGVRQDACMSCHEAELAAASDSHPPSKFKPLDKADLVAKLDARFCITCHEEHAADRTHAMGVTMPADYCYHCHSDIAETRPSHKGMAFDSCATAGCHNFHDNRGLNEPFLTAHLADPKMLATMRVPARSPSSEARIAAFTLHDADKEGMPRFSEAWSASAHAKSSVNCTACHAPESAAWTDAPDQTACARCHEPEVAGWLASRHGMRIAQHLPPMTPAMARLPMKPDVAHRQLSCASCHDPHTVDTRFAAADACIQCHNDRHTLAWADSPHGKLWRDELAGLAEPNTGVSCATCHMPREVHRDSGVETVRVQHNPNDNLRPNEKMLANVCTSCHGVGFALDSLADRDLIDRNFTGRPAVHVESLDMIRAKLLELERRRANTEPSDN